MSKVARIVMCGAAGRMGRRIIALAQDDSQVSIVGAVEAPGSEFVGKDAGELAGVGPIGVTITDDYASVATPGTVTLDFTIAEAALANARVAAAQGAGIIVGTSGLTRDERDEIAQLSKKIPCMIAANMSLGVNVLIHLVGDAVRRLGPGFDCEIVELHHNRKKDAPSGTAIALAEAAAEAKGEDPADAFVLSREGLVGERSAAEIGVVALRGGDNPGEHTVMLIGAGERVELVHRTTSRDCLAAGALAAARWLAHKPAGLYSMQDLISGAA